MYSELSCGVASGLQVSPSMAADMLVFISCRFFIEVLYILFRTEKYSMLKLSHSTGIVVAVVVVV